MGWALDKEMPQSLTQEALRVALLARQPGKGLIHHSDRGSQYAAHEYRDITALCGMQTSMSRKGNCWDNAAMESANGTLKVECVNRQKYETRQQARQDVLEFIGYYNHDRAHSSLGYLTPVAFEQAYAARQAQCLSGRAGTDVGKRATEPAATSLRCAKMPQTRVQPSTVGAQLRGPSGLLHGALPHTPIAETRDKKESLQL